MVILIVLYGLLTFGVGCIRSVLMLGCFDHGLFDTFAVVVRCIAYVRLGVLLFCCVACCVIYCCPD